MNKRKNNTSPLKIAVLGHKTIPSRQGGIEIVVEELTVRMAKLGHKITVYNRNGHHVSGKEFDEKKLKEYKGIRMKYVPTIDKKGLAAMSASFFAAVAAAFGKYDVVHFHGIPVGIPYMFIIVPTRWSLSGTVGMAAFCVIIGALFGVVLAAVIVVRAVWYVTMFPLSCLVRHREGRNGI